MRCPQGVRKALARKTRNAQDDRAIEKRLTYGICLSSRDTRKLHAREQPLQLRRLEHVLRAMCASRASPSREVVLIFNAFIAARRAREPREAIVRTSQYLPRAYVSGVRVPHVSLTSFATV